MSAGARPVKAAGLGTAILAATGPPARRLTGPARIPWSQPRLRHTPLACSARKRGRDAFRCFFALGRIHFVRSIGELAHFAAFELMFPLLFYGNQEVLALFHVK